MPKRKPIKTVSTDGTIQYRLSNGNLHRLDGPACEWADGRKDWWVDGKRHRLGGPAIEWANGSRDWYVNGEKHRLDGPASEWAGESKSWWVDNKKVDFWFVWNLADRATKLKLLRYLEA